MQFETFMHIPIRSYWLTLIIIPTMLYACYSWLFQTYISFLIYLRCSGKITFLTFMFSNFSDILKKSLNGPVIVLGIQEDYLKQYCPKDKRVVQISTSACALWGIKKLNNWGRQPRHDINCMSKLLMNLVKWQD